MSDKDLKMSVNDADNFGGLITAVSGPGLRLRPTLICVDYAFNTTDGMVTVEPKPSVTPYEVWQLIRFVEMLKANAYLMPETGSEAVQWAIKNGIGQHLKHCETGERYE